MPWAEDASVSALATTEATREVVTGVGFEIRVWEDLTADAVAFFDALSAGPSTSGPLGLHLLIPNLAVKGANLARNAREGRIALVRCVADAV